ncbi:MAG: hypothetical protein KatS3mg063_1543 [Tepidiforma sp.]|uniref:hypothetical protein n=1 Tax=Tepidiforma sp. TaxID=2682230 RepID=UPI0021DC9DBF|nr:hypothetical protein [Tepidiforma sp.]GIW15690.1 MAG: hypothetical protein KatS3mg063_1543 [Tepidiforma sp.]
MSAQFIVDGQPLPPPSEVKMSYLVLSEEKRALDGTLHVDHRGRRRVLALSWEQLSPAAMSQIEALLSPWRPLQAQWDEPSGTVTITAVPRPQGRQLVVGRSFWDASAQRWWWADVGLVLEEV